jgi:hypothetical protein
MSLRNSAFSSSFKAACAHAHVACASMFGKPCALSFPAAAIACRCLSSWSALRMTMRSADRGPIPFRVRRIGTTEGENPARPDPIADASSGPAKQAGRTTLMHSPFNAPRHFVQRIAVDLVAEPRLGRRVDVAVLRHPDTVFHIWGVVGALRHGHLEPDVVRHR